MSIRRSIRASMFRSASGDEDWYRIVAQTTGDLDIRVFFKQQGPLANGRTGLPGSGNLDIALYDIDGIITGFPTGARLLESAHSAATNQRQLTAIERFAFPPSLGRPITSASAAHQRRGSSRMPTARPPAIALRSTFTTFPSSTHPSPRRTTAKLMTSSRPHGDRRGQRYAV